MVPRDRGSWVHTMAQSNISSSNTPSADPNGGSQNPEATAASSEPGEAEVRGGRTTYCCCCWPSAAAAEPTACELVNIFDCSQIFCIYVLFIPESGSIDVAQNQPKNMF